MPPPIPGLHHVSALAGPPQPNAEFYTGVLGLRLVKRTVNFDDAGTYHLYYGDGLGRPGTAFTAFPWPNAHPGRAGAGTTSATAFAVPPGSLDEWMGRLADRALDFDAPEERFGVGVLRLRDPDGLALELVEDAGAEEMPGWPEGPVPAEHAIRAFHSVTLAFADPAPTAQFLADVFGFEAAGEDGERRRFRAPGGGPASAVDLVRDDALPRPGKGTVHHVAFRVPDGAALRAWREVLLDAGRCVTEVRDRRYFESVYFREPGGVLFELATDGPGFLLDEDEASLGTALRLPPWFEDRRAEIELRLPPLRLPTPSTHPTP